VVARVTACLALVTLGCSGRSSSDRGNDGASSAGSTSGSAGNGAGAAANAGGAGGRSGGATTSTGIGGAVATQITRCQAGGAVTPAYGFTDVLDTYQGTNGSFTDSCDATGNLVTYECAYTVELVGNPPDNAYYATGAVQSGTVDCGGRCKDGVCPNTCPQKDDSIRYLSVASNGDASFEDQTNGWSYACTLYQGGSDASCVTRQPGTVVQVTSQSPGCANAASFTTGGTTLPLCYYMTCTTTAP